MANNYFKFKQFTIFQDKTAMKVGTDGVLLGCWANANNNKQNILDIGTGTGLIALISAQRFPNSQITAIDINKNAFNQAVENITNSEFKNRITVLNQSLQEFAKTHTKKFDLIISNPPFFQKSLKSNNNDKNIARHDIELSYSDLIKCAAKILSPAGTICLIFPSEHEQNITEIILNNNLFINQTVYVKTTPQKSPKRILLKISNNKTKTISSNLTIEKSRHNYTDEFFALVKDFYL